jgi:hypothetical protein
MAQKPVLWLFIRREILDHSSHKVESESNVESTTWKLKWKNESVKMQVEVHPSRGQRKCKSKFIGAGVRGTVS